MSKKRLEFTLVSAVIGVVGANLAAAQSVLESAADVSTVRIESTGQHYTPRQSTTPDGVSRHTSDYELTIVWEPGAGRAREEWDIHTVYPVFGDLSFTMTYHEPFGLTAGQDSRAPSPETRPMSGARIGANFKELWLTNPLILAAHAETVAGSEFVVNGRRYERMSLFAHDTQWSMILDQSNGLPVEVATIEIDPHKGGTENKVLFSDWRDVSGVPFPFQVEQFLDDKLLRRETRRSVTVNAGAELELSEDLQDTDESLRKWGWSMSHFFLARAGLGAPQDYPETHTVSLLEVGDDIYQVQGGGSSNNLLVVGPDGLAIVDAPWFPERSQAVLEYLADRWPGKPLRYVILTHHHIDHSGGVGGYVQAGATLVTSQDNVSFFTSALKRAGHSAASVIAVGQRATLEGIGRPIEVYDIVNTHADGTIAAYVPDAQLVFSTDLFSPGRPRRGGVEALWISELVASIRFHGIEVERYVGGHGAGYGHPDDD